ncbi:MAG TPA: bifunctional D-glycero-beta-D-manno-heptose-7-phosphate kinase/D-glycero-beta-D-manno-heptose 1-phosphate adenylyltransferase HldE [Gammaproteobacteria bacterium]|nr:bifunctional D-glycero-beta-D-manno-heptose-7-phosphate kinase/D-glycero-beta-D-manno-heptose 1-phosphate adenylyltransferase HldE [Gammaproteobacteria bacterium]
MEVSLIGIVGQDEAAQTLKELLTAAHIHLNLQHAATMATITKQRIISRHQQLIRLDFENSFSELDQQGLVLSYQEHLSTVGMVVLSDYGKGTLANPQVFIQLARQAGLPILVDPKGTDFTRYRGATLITPNLKEFEMVVGRCSHEEEILKKGQDLIKQLELKALLLTRGDQGMTLIQPNQETLHLPAYAHEVYDVTGAGDTVIAVLAAGLTAQLALPQAVALANLAASIVVTKLGTASVSVPELDGMLKSGSSENKSIRKGIVNEVELLSLVQQARSQGKKVVFTNGCFDLIHAGHVSYLQEAKELGDYLIVAVNSDDSVKRHKGSERPINKLAQRMLVLAGLEAVDWVSYFSEDTPESLLRRIKPDILVKGGDYTIEEVVGADIVYAYGGEVRVLRCEEGLSTTSMIQRMAKHFQQESAEVSQIQNKG